MLLYILKFWKRSVTMLKMVNLLYKNYSPFIKACLCAWLLVGCSCKETLPRAKENKERSENQATDKGEVAQVSMPTHSHQKLVKRAIAYIKPVGDNKVRGAVVFTKVEDGIKIVADLEGLSPGLHGFHVHEHGDCSGKGAESTGAHYNPTGQKHGGPDSAERHVGDLGNIEANAQGHAHLERVDSIIQLDGPHSIIGRALVVHAGEDDYTTQPSGNAGDKIGCGAIEAF